MNDDKKTTDLRVLQDVPRLRFLFVQLYSSCNLRCPHCTFWQRPHTLKGHDGWQHRRHLAMRSALVEEFAAMNPRGVVVTHGGEALLDWDGYHAFCGECRARGLKVFSVTNGTQVFSAERARELVTRGPTEVTVSLDSVVPEVHDRFRGMPGAFGKAVRTLRLLLEARRETSSPVKVNAMLLVGRSTYETLLAAYDFVLGDLGADKLKLNMVQPSFGMDGEVDPFFADQHDVDPVKLRQVLEAADAKYGLRFDPRWVDQVTMYFGSVRGNPLAPRGWRGDMVTKEHVCNSYDRNVWVSEHGVMQLCCDSKWEGTVWGKPGDLRAFWEGAGEQRAKMAGCNSLCGISHSLRNTSSTLKATRHGT